MSKTEQIVEHVAVTFFEAAAAYLIVIPTVNWNKTLIAGAVGAGLSAVYNLLRQSNPTLVDSVSPSANPTTTGVASVVSTTEQLPVAPEVPVDPSQQV